MKYINNIKVALLAVTLSAFGTSCTDWLDVQPTDRVLEKQVYTSEININAALNGIYLTMANTSLYGRNLTFYTTELIAQRYHSYVGQAALNSHKERPELVALNYSESGTWTHLNTIFSKGYNLILNINLFIEKLSATTGVVSESRKNLMLGEAYALRAFMHLDLLRLYGPVPNQESDGLSIPYYTKPDVEWEELQKNSYIIDRILEDIETALQLLENDPVRREGVVIGDDSNNDDTDFFYTDYRNRRMNYFAVSALKVRTLMYKGGDEAKGEAALLAKTLIETPEFNNAFPWATYEDTFMSRKQDKVFSKEVLFGIHVSGMYTQWETWFNPGKTSGTEVLAVYQPNYNYMFVNSMGGLTSDWRAGFWVDFPNYANYKLSTKFQKTEDATDVWYFQPLIRKSELYLVAAEVYKDAAFIDDIRVNRNLTSLDPMTESELQEEIGKEYMREFVGEGQLWFYYKRRYQTTIRRYDGTNRTVSASQYVLPKPSKETEER